MENNKLGALNIAFIYVGAIMGAGFASGRETWQFFGVFGKVGIVGMILFALLFLAIGHMIRYNAKILNTNDMGKIIVPGNISVLENAVGYVMAVILANVLVTMSAAGGALLHQQWGLNYTVGGIVITILVILTVIGDFHRISKVFKYIMPVLCVAMTITCIVVIASEGQSGGVEGNIVPSPVASNWGIASILYVAYNVLALVSIVATSALNAKSDKSAILGTTLGGLCVGLLALLILLTVLCDMEFSQSLDMPVLGYATRISPLAGYIYTGILFCAIYSAATSSFYGFTTKVKEGPHKKKIIVLAAAAAFCLGLVGFKNIIAYVAPIMGYIGLAIVVMLVINFFVLYMGEKRKKKEFEKKEDER